MLAGLVQFANSLALTRGVRSSACQCVILTGRTGSGKTTLARAVIERLQLRGMRVGGILAPGLLDDDRRTGFDIIDLTTGDRTALAREQRQTEGRHARWSRFAFRPDGLTLGQRALGPAAWACDVIVVDEVGPFELSGGGWAPALDRLTREYGGILLLVARESIVDAVRARWGSTDTVVCDVAACTAAEIAGLMTPDAAAPPTPAPTKGQRQDEAAGSKPGPSD
jgi:nucleoside-triphosphatase THEP1